MAGWLSQSVSEVLSRARNQGEETTGPLHFILVQYIVLHRYCVLFFNINWMLAATLWQASLLMLFIPTALAHFLSLCHILVILALFQSFSLLIYLLRWSVTSDLWCYYYRKSVNIKCVLTLLPTCHSPLSLPHLRPLYSFRHYSNKIRPVNNYAVASKQSSEGRISCLSIKNQKLKMTKLSKERQVESRDRPKARSFVPNS